MNRKLPNEFIFSLVSLALAIVIVHSTYVLHVRPMADSIMASDREKMAADPNYVSQRSIYVVIKDYEQEAEIILMLWALALMAYKALAQRAEQGALANAPLKLPDGMKILPEDTREYARQIEVLAPEDRSLLVPRAVLAALARFGATRSVQDASTVAHGICQSEAERLDSELSMLRYIAWAIPAIGFIGTVRGIGDALSMAHKAVTGDISGVTEGLGVAFNSTLIALLLSILLMFLLQQLQQVQERHVLDTETWLDQRVIRNLQARA
jgi:biopolymer transport protein ExbB/TolQ